MTVRELRRRLDACDADSPVYFMHEEQGPMAVEYVVVGTHRDEVQPEPREISGVFIGDESLCHPSPVPGGEWVSGFIQITRHWGDEPLSTDEAPRDGAGDNPDRALDRRS